MDPRVVKMPPLSVRADLGPRSIDDEARTVELVITTTAGVRRRDWWTGKEYVEILSMDPAHVRLDRLNDGAPLLDSHNSFSVADQLGAVVPGSVELMKKALLGKVRFSKREAVDPVWQDVKDGIVRNVSVGYRVWKFEETQPKGENALPIRRAIDWEPFEVSMVPIPADAGAKVRAGESTAANECEVVSKAPAEDKTAGADPAPAKEEKTTMREETRSQTILEPDPLAPPPAPAPPPEPNERDLGAVQERERCQGITVACRAARVPQAFCDKLIADGVSLVKAQSMVFEEMAKRERGGPGDISTKVPIPTITGGEDPLVHVREGIENAILHRIYPKQGERGFDLTELGRQYRGLSLVDVARLFVGQQRGRTTNMSRMEILGVALGLTERAGYHTTTDFALLLADVAGKTLRQAYEEAPQTFGPITRRTTLPDFKDAKRLQIGEAPTLNAVDEHGEFTHGTIGEAREVYHLATYGRIFAITRQALVNDDTDAFSRVAMLFGRAARNLESDLLWGQITANPAMGDGNPLFDAAHNNLDAVGVAISVEAIGEGRAQMRRQTGLDGVTVLNLTPQFIIVPAALETLADQFVSQNLMANQASVVNPFAGRLQVIAEPRLDADSQEAWYLAASPAQIDILELATLEGEAGPMIENRVGFDVDGLEIKCRHDIGAKVIDWRGISKSVGVSAT